MGQTMPSSSSCRAWPVTGDAWLGDGYDSVAAVHRTIERWAPSRPVHAIGPSFGAAVWLQVLLEHLGRVRSVITVNGFACVPLTVLGAGPLLTV